MRARGITVCVIKKRYIDRGGRCRVSRMHLKGALILLTVAPGGTVMC